jgi:hypothetical protein
MTVPDVDPDAAMLEIAIKFDHDADFDASQRSVDELEIPNWLDAPDDCERLLDPDGEGSASSTGSLCAAAGPSHSGAITRPGCPRVMP